MLNWLKFVYTFQLKISVSNIDEVLSGNSNHLHIQHRSFSFFLLSSLMNLFLHISLYHLSMFQHPQSRDRTEHQQDHKPNNH